MEFIIRKILCYALRECICKTRTVIKENSDFRKSLKNRDLTIEVDTPMDPNHKIEKIRPDPQKWLELC